MFFGRLGLDYFLNNRTTLSLTGFTMHHGGGSTSDITMNTDSLYPAGKISQYSQEEINSTRSFNGRGATLGVKRLFAKEKEEWTADASYFSGNASNNSLYSTYAYQEPPALSAATLQKIAGGGNDHNIILQSDFSDPLSSKTTLETGVRAALQGRLNINNNYTYDADSAAYALVPSAASNYKSNSNVYAAYVTLGSSIGNFTYKAGVRAESSSYHGVLLNSGQSFANQYPISLFPSLFLGQKLGDGQEIQLSYTRRVNRPNFFQLVPYTDSSNKLNITRGNPDLVPEFTQSVELSWLKTFNRNSTLLASIYYKHTDHLITGYIEADTNSASGAVTFINTFVNAESSNSLGAEVTWAVADHQVVGHLRQSQCLPFTDQCRQHGWRGSAGFMELVRKDEYEFPPALGVCCTGVRSVSVQNQSAREYQCGTARSSQYAIPERLTGFYPAFL